MANRVFLIVLDSFGVGAEPDAPQFGDAGTDTLGAIVGHPNFKGDNLAKLGMFNLDGVTCGTPVAEPIGSFARLREASAGKDTTIGHWEIAGLLSADPLPTFPNGFPKDLLDAFTAKTGFQVLCNKPYSGTEVIRDYGEEHMKTGALIVYTSADSVFQIAANEAIVFNNKTYKELTFKIKIMELKHFYIISTLLLIILFATIYFLHEQITASWTDTPSYTVEKQYEPVKLPTIHHEEDSGTSGFDYEDTGAHSDTITLRQNQDEGIFWRSIILSGQPDSVLIVFDSTFSKNPARVIHISNTLFLDFNRK